MANVSGNRPQQVTGWIGWVQFASVLMFLSGVAHIFLGAGAVLAQSWYLYAIGNVYLLSTSSWGWSLMIGGILLILSAMLLMAGNIVGRIAAIVLLFGSVIANIALFPAAPIWSILVIALDVVILYAVIAHGGEMKYLGKR